MKKVVVFLVVALMCLSLLSACSNDNNESEMTGDTVTDKVDADNAENEQSEEDTADDSQEQITLKYWALARWSGITGTEEDGQVGDWQREMARQFMETHPNITVEFEHIPAGDIAQKLSVAIATGNQPDILEDGVSRGAGFARMGVLLPLNDYFTEEEKADFGVAWDNGSIMVDGQSYMIPWSNSVQIMLINKSLFEEAGALDLLPQNEDKSWTYEEFYTAMQAVSVTDAYPASLFFGSTAGDSYLYDILMGSGGRIYDQDGNFTFNSPEIETGLEFVMSLVNDGLTVPGAETLKYSDDKELFKQQKTAVCMMGSAGYYKQLLEMMESGEIDSFDIDYALFPNAAGEAPVLEANWIGYMAFKSGDSAREDAAVEFAKFVTNTENSKALAAVELIPLRESVGDLYPGNEIAAWQKNIFKYAIDPGYGFDNHVDVTNEVIAMMQSLAIGQTDVKTALENLETKVNSGT